MPGTPLKEEANESYDSFLKGTTYRVYCYIMKQRTPVGISKVQRGLGLSSPSVANYHIKKLLQLGLIKEEQEGYVIDKVVFENIIRIRRVSIPVQAAYATFFGVTLIILLVFLRPPIVDSIYFFAMVINGSAFSVSLYEMAKTLKHL